MAIDYSRVPVWLDNVFEDRQRSPQLSFKVHSESVLGSLEEVFEEDSAISTSTSTEANGYHRQQLVVTSATGDRERGENVHFSTGSRSASSSCGSPRGQSVCSPEVTAQLTTG